MTKLKRFTGKVFGGSATAVGDDPQIAQFGSALANTFVGTTDPEIIQQLPAWGQGWIGAVTPTQQYPALPEMTGAMKVLSHQICGILQQGVSTWDNGTVYYTGNFVSLNGKLYISQTDENQGNNPTADITNWQEFSSGGGGLEIGDVAFTQMAIDESKGKRRKLNGQIIVQEQYQELTNILKASIAQNPDLSCTEQEWQAEIAMSTVGICYKFVVDDVGGTIRLPKYPNYFIGGVNDIAPVIGNGMTLGLTDTIGHNVGLGQYVLGTTQGAVRLSTATYGKNAGDFTNPGSANNGCTFGVTTDPTKSGVEAQINQEQIKGTYFIQVATGAETEENIVNTLELNNPFVLLEPKFFENEIYNVSWLLANGTYNGSNAIHPSAYQALIVENNAEVAIGSTVTLPIGTEYTKRGLSVKLSTDSDITDYDFVLNTTDETFRLPIKVNLASGKAVVGNGMTLGMTNGTNNFGTFLANSYGMYGDVNAYGKNVGSGASESRLETRTAGVTTDPTKSGIELSDSNLYLYFYVGETVQNANIVNLGRIEEKLNNFLSINNKEEIISWGMPDYSSAVAISVSSSYTVPYDGFLYLFSNWLNGASSFTINGASYSLVSGPNTSGTVSACAFVPVNKGDNITFTKMQNGKMIPLKGAN